MTNPIAEPQMTQDTTGTYISTNGAHHRLRKTHLLPHTNSFILYNLVIAGNTKAGSALTRRHTGFHEAGHLWAAHRLDLDINPVRLANRVSPFASDNADDELLLRAIGPLAVSVSVEADTCEFLNIDTGYGNDFGPSMLPSSTDPGWIFKDAPDRQQRRSQTYMHHASHWYERDDLCLRGGDRGAEQALFNIGWLDTTLPEVLTAWFGITRLAERLMTGNTVSAADTTALLRDPGAPH